jgi:plasmid maintenance system killer protein
MTLIKIPAPFRQKVLEKLIAALLEKYNIEMEDKILARKRAIVEATEKESELYAEAANKTVQWQLVCSYLRTLKK